MVAWVWLCVPLLPLCTLVSRKQQRCWLVNPVFLWCLIPCELHVAVSQNVAVVGWGPAVNPLRQCVCQTRALVAVSMSCAGSALRRLLIHLSIYLGDVARVTAAPPVATRVLNASFSNAPNERPLNIHCTSAYTSRRLQPNATVQGQQNQHRK